MRKPSESFTRTITVLLVFVLSLLTTNARAADSDQLRKLLVIGDSISAAYGINVSDGWVALLDDRLTAEGYPLEVVNSSVSGDTSANGLSRLPTLLADYEPAIVIIELGGNDGLRGLSLKNLRANLQSMAEQSQAAGADVLLLGVQIPSNYGAAYTGLFTKTFSQVAEDTNSSLVPSVMDGMQGSIDLFLDDGIHPSAEAQSLLLDNVWSELEPMLQRAFQ